jgi:hypothetical protein
MNEVFFVVAALSQQNWPVILKAYKKRTRRDSTPHPIYKQYGTRHFAV